MRIGKKNLFHLLEEIFKKNPLPKENFRQFNIWL